MRPCPCGEPIRSARGNRCGLCRQEARRANDRARKQRQRNFIGPADLTGPQIEARLAQLDAEAKQRRWRMQ